jgi:hypothetical protein
MIRKGQEITIDGIRGRVSAVKAGEAFVSWYVGEPMRRRDGSVLGYGTVQLRDEWIATASPRLTPASRSEPVR